MMISDPPHPPQKHVRGFGSGGDDGKLGERMAQVDAHVGSFAEANLQTTPSHEWILKSPPWGDTWTYATP
jgi:hypothetical protein